MSQQDAKQLHKQSTGSRYEMSEERKDGLKKANWFIVARILVSASYLAHKHMFKHFNQQTHDIDII